MREISRSEAGILAPLFSSFHDHLLHSYLDGCMGQGWADDPVSPKWGKVVVGDFGFLAGMPSADAVRELPPLMVATPGWDRAILQAHPETRAIQRYAMDHPSPFDPELLQRYVCSLRKEYRLAQIDEALYHQSLTRKETKDFVSVFDDWDHYHRQGAGFVALLEDGIVGGASSYAAYHGGIEIQVETLPEHRRKGVALACCAQLILHCLEHGLYPSWDAANLQSVALAQKLGYRMKAPYTAYFSPTERGKNGPEPPLLMAKP